MTIAILGGAGYIGSHVVKYLHQQGIPLVVYDNLSQGYADAVTGHPLIVGDIGDTYKLTQCFKDYHVTAVMNFAGFIAVGESVQNPQKYYQNNVSQTLNLLDAMLACGVRDFVFSSTCAIYGPPQFLPLTEEHPFAPMNPYGRTKLAFEYVLEDYARAYDFRYVSLRYFNASGADPEGVLGERHEPETHLIPLMLQAVLGQRAALNIYGTDYPTADGTCIRDYIHVWDLAQAHLLALQYLQQGQSNVFNLGNGAGYSVLEVIQMAEKVTGLKVPTQICPRREGDPAVLIGSSQKALEILGWKPVYGDLESILSSAWNWHQTCHQN